MPKSTSTKPGENASLAVLKAATAQIREEYINRYVQLALIELELFRKGLAEVGMDADKFAPYPDGNMDRSTYRQAERKYRRVRSYFRAIKGCRGMREPEIVVEIEGASDRLVDAATESANGLVDAYLIKLLGKIGKPVAQAETNGNIWDYAILTVVCADGEEQVWRTNCILNRSCLGTLFNQWPTRRTK